MWSSYYITTSFSNIPVHTAVLFCIHVFETITTPIIVGLLIRFERVQVQLRAQEENTIKILKSIKRVKIQEVVFIVTLVGSNFFDALGYYGSIGFGFTFSTIQSLETTGYILDIGILCILSYSMNRVNRQLALFFD